MVDLSQQSDIWKLINACQSVLALLAKAWLYNHVIVQRLECKAALTGLPHPTTEPPSYPWSGEGRWEGTGWPLLPQGRVNNIPPACTLLSRVHDVAELLSIDCKVLSYLILGQEKGGGGEKKCTLNSRYWVILQPTSHPAYTSWPQIHKRKLLWERIRVCVINYIWSERVSKGWFSSLRIWSPYPLSCKPRSLDLLLSAGMCVSWPIVRVEGQRGAQAGTLPHPQDGINNLPLASTLWPRFHYIAAFLVYRNGPWSALFAQLHIPGHYIHHWIPTLVCYSVFLPRARSDN